MPDNPGPMFAGVATRLLGLTRSAPVFTGCAVAWMGRFPWMNKRRASVERSEWVIECSHPLLASFGVSLWLAVAYPGPAPQPPMTVRWAWVQSPSDDCMYRSCLEAMCLEAGTLQPDQVRPLVGTSATAAQPAQRLADSVAVAGSQH